MCFRASRDCLVQRSVILKALLSSSPPPLCHFFERGELQERGRRGPTPSRRKKKPNQSLSASRQIPQPPANPSHRTSSTLGLTPSPLRDATTSPSGLDCSDTVASRIDPGFSFLGSCFFFKRLCRAPLLPSERARVESPLLPDPLLNRSRYLSPAASHLVTTQLSRRDSIEFPWTDLSGARSFAIVWRAPTHKRTIPCLRRQHTLSPS